jgi:hypothetical protein
MQGVGTNLGTVAWGEPLSDLTAVGRPKFGVIRAGFQPGYEASRLLGQRGKRCAGFTSQALCGFTRGVLKPSGRQAQNRNAIKRVAGT